MFIVDSQNTSNFAAMEKMFTVIDAPRMSTSKMQVVCNQEEFLTTQKEYGFFELQMWINLNKPLPIWELKSTV